MWFGQLSKEYDTGPYTPVWTASVANPTLGNGTLTGRYYRLGKQVRAIIKLQFGTTTTGGTGTWSFSLPFTANTSVGGNGIATLIKAGGNNYVASTLLATVTTFITIFNASANNVDANNPFVWANLDNGTFVIDYEIP